MGDVLTAISIGLEGLSLCVKAITLLKKFFTSVKHAREELNSIVSLVEKAKNRLELIKLTLVELRTLSEPGITSTFVGACSHLNSTLEELVQDASAVVGGQPRLGVAKRLKWSMEKHKAEDIIRRLKEQEEAIAESFLVINLWATTLGPINLNLRLTTSQTDCFTNQERGGGPEAQD